MNCDSAPVLVAEDEESDALILQYAFRKARISRPLLMVRDGQEVVDYLLGQGPYAEESSCPLPAFILSDLKMPRMDGLDLLKWLARHAGFKNVPAVVLSSSSDESDILKARQLGARDYFVKPHGFPELVRIIEQLLARWAPSGADRTMTSNASPAPVVEVGEDASITIGCE